MFVIGVSLIFKGQLWSVPLHWQSIVVYLLLWLPRALKQPEAEKMQKPIYSAVHICKKNSTRCSEGMPRTFIDDTSLCFGAIRAFVVPKIQLILILRQFNSITLVLVTTEKEVTLIESVTTVKPLSFS